MDKWQWIGCLQALVAGFATSMVEDIPKMASWPLEAWGYYAKNGAWPEEWAMIAAERGWPDSHIVDFFDDDYDY